jgi:hypothetical protein
MPYIEPVERKQFEAILDELLPKLTLDIPGNVVYVLYAIIVRLWRRKKKFNSINTIRGILWSTLVEFDRSEASYYEDGKIRENGDVK